MATSKHCFAFMVTILILGAAPHSSAANLSELGLTDAQITDVTREMSVATWSEVTAEKFVSQYGDKAIPILSEFALSSDYSVAIRGKAAAYLGKTHSPEVIPLIKQVIVDAMKTTKATDDWQGFQSALNGMGFVGTDQAVDYLKTIVSGDYFKTVSTIPTVKDSQYDTEKKMRQRIRESALLSIGCAGTEYASAYLHNRKALPNDLPHSYLKAARKEARKRASGEYLKDREKYQPLS